MADVLKKSEVTWWKGIIVILIGVVIWGIRLESQVLAIKKDMGELQILHMDHIEVIMDDIRVIKNIQIKMADKLDIQIEY